MRCCVPTRCAGQRATQSDSARHENALTWPRRSQSRPSSHPVPPQNKTAQSIRSLFFFLFSFQGKSRSHANGKCTHKHTRTGRRSFILPPRGQTHLKGNVAESDSEQFLMARLAHYAVLWHACVCVRYVWVRVTTYYEGPAARSLDGVQSDRRAGDVNGRLWLVRQRFADFLVVDMKVS